MGPQNSWLFVKATKRDSPLQETAETEAPCQSKHNIEPLISFVSFRGFFFHFFYVQFRVSAPHRYSLMDKITASRQFLDSDLKISF